MASFGAASTAEEVTEGIDLSGRVYVLTGCNSGIGEETLRVLGLRGAEVIGLARTAAKAQAALDKHGVAGTAVACDLSDPDSVRAAVATVRGLGRRLSGIIANAGIMALPEPRTTLGLDLQFLTNHIGHFILVTGLVDLLTDDGRVVMVSSGAHFMAPEVGIEFDNLSGQRGYHPWRTYGQSKLANLLTAKVLAGRLGDGQTANAIHPGVIQTNLGRHLDDYEGVLDSVGRDNLKTVGQGAATQVFVAVHPDAAALTGLYFQDCKVKEPSAAAQDEALAERLWAVSEELVAGL
ncbi:MAG: SDR family NAD(P)-dependent oxidoreductase [Alphaproteobacteria bacterium]|nr:SDR family NAD(P)-dependent oxidoreductase [Alphaproteobacteria bacterium]MCB9791099.1 SDR family NAD(P)-dependent oxidoreductase [Alphaproteobacteria bacterium]